MKKFLIVLSAWFFATVMIVPLIEGSYPADPTADIPCVMRLYRGFEHSVCL